MLNKNTLASDMTIKRCQHTEFCNEEQQNAFAAAPLMKQLPIVMMVIQWV